MHHVSEDGNHISSWTDGAIASAAVPILQRYSRMYCLKIVRVLVFLLVELQYAVMKTHEVPHFSDFFGIFYNNDSYFRSRKTWDPYNP